MNGHKNADGMTLRDYFAVKALPMAIAKLTDEDGFEWATFDDGGPASDQILAAEYAYTMADAMLKARAES